jgi:hypothetical protein
MRRIFLSLLALTTLLACDRSNAPPPAADAPLLLTCSAFAAMSADALTAAHGAENIGEETLPGPEGEQYTATILYPDDPLRRLEIVWRDDAHAAPASIMVSGEASAWAGPHALSLGQPLADVETINGAPFRLFGFEWDYGGWVSDWNGGALAPLDGCMTRVRFSATAANASATGDSEFASDSAEVRTAAPVVSKFSLNFTD